MDYWKKYSKDSVDKSLDFRPPEQKSRSGTLAIVGGSSSNFRTVSYCANISNSLGVNETKVILPDSLKKTIPPTTGIVFADSEPSGGFSKSSEPILTSTITASDALLLPGDLGKNSETAIVVADIVKNITIPTFITRDAVSIITPEASTWLENDNISIMTTLPDLQKLFRAVYYPKIITLSMPLNQLVEALHKFTVSYPPMIILATSDQYIVAKAGIVSTVGLRETGYTSLTLWRGDFATKLAVWNIWNQNQPEKIAVAGIFI